MNFSVTKNNSFRVLYIVFLFLFNFISFAQNKKADEILAKGKKLFRLEKASWYSTDMFLGDYPEKRDSIGGYISYEKDKKVYSVYYSKYDKNIILARYVFDSIPSDKHRLELNRKATPLESDLIVLREDAVKRAYTNADGFFSFFENTSYNFIPVIEANKKQVYILTGPQVYGEVIIGNDYLLTYNKKNKFKKKEKLHNSLLKFPYKFEEEGKKMEMTMHSHVVTELITETDICTLLLYKDFVEWDEHLVMSKKYVSIFDLKQETLQVIKTKVWKKIANAEQEQELKKNKK